MKEVSKEEFLELFDPSVHDKLREALERYPGAEGLVCFTNVAFDSSSFGKRTAIVVGPSNTFTSFKFCEGKWLNDLPSQRQYPDEYVKREVFLE